MEIKAFKRKKTQTLRRPIECNIIDKKKHSDFGGGSFTSTLVETIGNK